MDVRTHGLIPRPKNPITIPDRVATRVITKVKPGPGSCINSTYSVASHGYAQVGWHDETGRHVTLCHRVAWTVANGTIPYGATIDHTCKNRQCVNIEHLRLLCNFENARRTNGRDWPMGQCVNGHSNEHLTHSGGRLRCRKCAAQYQRNKRARKKNT